MTRTFTTTPSRPRGLRPSRSIRPSFPRVVAAASLLAALAALQGCAASTDGLPPIYKEPDQTMFSGERKESMERADTTTQWWLPGSPDPLSEASRLSRDTSQNVKSPLELLGKGAPINEADVIRLALANNLDVRIGDKDRRAAVADVLARRGQVYDTVARLSYNESERENIPDPNASASSSSIAALAGLGAAGSSAEVTKTQTRSGRASLSQRFFTGGTVELFAQESRTDEDDPSADNDTLSEAGTAGGVTITQPLLRGFGKLVTEQPITAARINQEISEEQFRETLIAQVAESLRAYYDLIFALENAAVQRISLQQALDLLDINISREKVGDLAIVDVEQARANAASRKEQYLVAIQGIYDAEDRLRQLLNVKQADDLGWETALLPTDVPAYADVEATEGALLQSAWANRPDWRRVTLGVDLADLNEAVSRNALLPSLNLTATFQADGRGESGSDAREQSRDQDYDGYEVGVELSYPLLNREARYTNARRRLETQRAKLQVEKLALGILTEIRQRLRSLRTNRLRVDVTNEAVRAEWVKYEAELKRYEVGLSTSFQLLEFLEDLSTAKVNNLRAIIDYQRSLIDLEQSTGTLLQSCGVTIEAGTISMAPEYVRQSLAEQPSATAELIPGLQELSLTDAKDVPTTAPYAADDRSMPEPFGEVLPEIAPRGDEAEPAAMDAPAAGSNAAPSDAPEQP